MIVANLYVNTDPEKQLTNDRPEVLTSDTTLLCLASVHWIVCVLLHPVVLRIHSIHRVRLRLWLCVGDIDRPHI